MTRIGRDADDCLVYVALGELDYLYLQHPPCRHAAVARNPDGARPSPSLLGVSCLEPSGAKMNSGGSGSV